MEKKKGIPEFVGQLIAVIIGWLFCMVVLAGAYLLGYALAPHLGGRDHREAFGLLSALAVIWMFEHERANDRWSKFFNRDG